MTTKTPQHGTESLLYPVFVIVFRFCYNKGKTSYVIAFANA